MGIAHSGLSGIRAATTDLSTTGNNVANAGTVGFKTSSVEFADIISGQVGGGVSVSAVRQSFEQGSILGTGNDWDLAVSGRGFFKVSDSSGQANTTKDSYYTRNGAFSMDNEGYVVNSRGMRLHMFPASGTGNNISFPISTNTSEILLPQEDSQAQTTALATGSFNIDAGESALGTDATVEGDSVTAGAMSGLTINGVIIENVTVTDNAAGAALVVDAINAKSSDTGVTASVTSTNKVTLTADSPRDSIIIGNTGAAGADTSFSGLTEATTTRTATALDPSSSSSYHHSVAMVVYDTLGEKHTVNTYFQKVGDGQWDVYTQRTDTDGTAYPSDSSAIKSAELTFDSSGVLSKVVRAVTGQTAPGDTADWSGLTEGTEVETVYDTTGDNNVTTSTKLTINTGYTTPATISTDADKPGWIKMDIDGTSQFAGDFRIINIGQDGYASGALTSVNIDESGIVQANYTNGNSSEIGKIALFAFNNPGGLKQQGGVLWATTSDSGDPRPGSPGESIYGRIKSQSLESSTVDVTEELVNLITAQRNFQANAKMISAGQEMNQVVLNI